MNRSSLLRGFLGAALLGLLSFATHTVQAQSLATQIVGKWQAQLDDEVITLIFGKDGSFTLIEDEGDPQEGSYELDEDHDPAWLDIAMGDDEAEFSIVAIDDDGNLHITEPRSKRPAAFNEDNELIFEAVAKGEKPKPEATDDAPSFATKLLGKWQMTVDEEDTLTLYFGDDGTFIVHESDGEPKEGTYELDENHDPAWLDITMGEGGARFSIAAIDEDGKLHITEPKSTRPGAFNAKNEMILELVADEKKPKPEASDDAEPEGIAAEIIGTWEGREDPDDEEVIRLTFGKDGSFSLTEGDEDAMNGTYTIDDTQDPVALDITMEGTKQFSIIKMDDEGRLVVTEPKMKRATDFSDESDALTFTKVGVEDAEAAPEKPESSPEEADLEAKLLGTWSATFKEEKVSLIFGENGSFLVKEGSREQKKGSYTVEADKDPFVLNISIEDETKSSLLKFDEEGRLVMTKPSEELPEDFSKENTSPLAFTKEEGGEEAAQEAPADDEAMEAANAEILEALVGKWSTTLEEKEITFTFTEDQEFSLEMAGNAAKEGTFTFDISEEPWTMNLVPAKDKNDVGYTIFEFTEAGQLHIAQPKGDEEDRPTDFSSGKPLLLDPVEE